MDQIRSQAFSKLRYHVPVDVDDDILMLVLDQCSDRRGNVPSYSKRTYMYPMEMRFISLIKVAVSISTFTLRMALPYLGCLILTVG